MSVITEFEKRAAVKVALSAGRSPTEIVNFLNVPRSLVYRVKSKGNDVERKKHRRRSDSKRNEMFLGRVADKVAENPGKSMRKLASEFSCAPSTISLSISDLGLHSYALKHRHLLTDRVMESRLAKASALLNNLKHDTAGFLRLVPNSIYFF